MIDPIAVGQTKRYVSKLEKENEPNPTVWVYGSIDSIMKAEIIAAQVNERDLASKETNLPAKFASFDFEIIRFGLKGFENFGTLKFETAKRKLFDREVDVLSDEVLRCIPLDIIRELAEKIWADNHVDEALSKN